MEFSGRPKEVAAAQEKHPEINPAARIGAPEPPSPCPSEIPPLPTPNFNTLEIDYDRMLKHHVYDGLGRVISTQSPYPDADTSGGALRTERFYYDGVRRIQEVVSDPEASLAMAMQSQNSAVAGAAQSAAEATEEQSESINAAADSEAQAMSAQAIAEGEEGGSPSQLGANQAPVVYNRWLDREYVWGPGDNGMDELLVQYDRDRKAWYVLQDAGGDVIALIEHDAAVPANSSGGLPAARAAYVAGQWTYDAYGACLNAEDLRAHPVTHVGHKALFVDRVDIGIVDGTTGQESPRVIPYAHAFYQNRNRTYSPQHGRFLQRDPNASAMTLLAASSYHGRGFGAIAATLSFDEMYGDGFNLYQYLGSNPWNRSDPMGLSYDPFDMVDDYLAGVAGERSAFLSRIGQDLKSAAIVAATVASYLPFPFVGEIGDLALYALGEQSGTETAAALALGLIPGGKLLGFIGSIGKSSMDVAIRYVKSGGAAKGLRKLLGGAKQFATNGLLAKADELIEATKKACGCFAAGTLIWTSQGLVPIEQVTLGDLVLAFDQDTGNYALREVTHIFIRDGAPLIQLSVASTNGISTYTTTEEHPFRASGCWIRADQVRPGDLIESVASSPVIVVSRVYISLKARVYNFEVDGLHTYYIGSDGVLVHNNNLVCDLTSGLGAVLQGATKTGSPSNVVHFVKSGGEAAALKDLAQMSGKSTFNTSKDGLARFVDLPDGSRARMYNFSNTTGSWTIKISPPPNASVVVPEIIIRY